MLLTTPLIASACAWARRRLEHRAIRAWSAGLMRVFGFRLRRIGTPLPGAAMFVANHVSWIDIETLHSQRMMGFVAKREIQSWPVVGWLAQRGETIFHSRGSTESLGGVLHEMLARLRSGRSGRRVPRRRHARRGEVGPFHARIFLAAVEAGVPVQPVALLYGEGGNAQHVVAFQPRESFFANFVRLLGEPHSAWPRCISWSRSRRARPMAAAASPNWRAAHHRGDGPAEDAS